MKANRPIEQSCYWLAQRRTAAEPPLEGHHETDIVVVGAGFTGVWTSLFLKEIDPALQVTVVEQGVAAYGASGRNAGMLGEGIDHSPALSVEHFGWDEARRLDALGRQNIIRFIRFLEERGIDCDLERSGRLDVALSEEQFEHLRHSAETAQRLGSAHWRVLSGPELRGMVHCDRYHGGLLNPNTGMLDPVKLVDGLKREAKRLGVRFFERSRVMDVSPSGAGVRVRTKAGEVTGRRAVLATNAYSHHLLPRLRWRFLPLYDYILVSDPLTPAQHEAIGWSGRQTLGDARNFFKYYRLTADNRILWGTSEALYFRGNRVDESCDHSERHYVELRESFFRHFPALAGLRFPYAWGGPICSTTRFTPFFGSVADGRILYGLGYTGHGVASTRIGGEVLAHMALDKPSPLLDLSMVKKMPFPFPPEPLRSLSIGAVTRALRRVDNGGRPGLFLRCLEAMGIGLSS